MRLRGALIAVAVAVALADSSIVVLALPELYGAFDTSIEGVAWVITSYNLVVAVGAFVLVPVTGRRDARRLAAAGLALFLAASIACAAAGSLAVLIAARSVQGLGAALLLAGSLPLLCSLAGSTRRGIAAWTLAGTLGVALGPATGGTLTQLFDWRAIFVVQAPVAGAALLATAGAPAAPPPVGTAEGRGRAAVAADAGLALVFGALVGALFLSVLLVVTVWGLSPLAGALVVSALPVCAIAARPLAARLSAPSAVAGGAGVLAAGFLCLAFLPSTSRLTAALALGFCGAGLGLAVPALTRASISGDIRLARSATLSIGARHAGLVLALVLIAPLLAGTLDRGADRAISNGTASLLDSPLGLGTKIGLAIDLADAIASAPRGEIPDVGAVFHDRGVSSNDRLRELEHTLVGTIEGALTRSFRNSFVLSALMAALASLSALALRRSP